MRRAELLAYRELDDTLSLTDTGADELADARTGKNGRHRVAGLLCQSVFRRLAVFQQTPPVQPRRRERLLMPLLRHS